MSIFALKSENSRTDCTLRPICLSAERNIFPTIVVDRTHILHPVRVILAILMCLGVVMTQVKKTADFLTSVCTVWLKLPSLHGEWD
jgi:hypothetical protein